MSETVAITRTADVVAMEIQALTTQVNTQVKALVLSYAVEIGRKLCEAKEMVDHGEWGNWLEGKTEFSQSTAENLMNIFREYGSDQIGFFGHLKSEALGNLGYTKALKLLAVPADEREDFAKEIGAENLSSRELEKAIKDRDKAIKDRDAAQTKETQAQTRENIAAKRASDTQKDLDLEKKRASEAAAEADLLRKELRALKDEKRAPKAPEAEPGEEAMKAAERELQAKIDAADRRALDAESRAEDLRKQLAVADPAVAKFSALYEEVQALLGKLMDLILQAAPEKRAGLRRALDAALEKYSDQVRGMGA